MGHIAGIAGEAEAAVLIAPGKPFELQRFPVVPPGPGQVLVRVSCCTVCGSDVHAWTGRRPPSFLPAIVGHEIAGTVEVPGPDAPLAEGGGPLTPGDRITFTLTASCGCCFFCKDAGLPQKCTGLFKYGHTRCDNELALTGGLSEFLYLVPGTRIFKLSESVSDEAAATAMCAGATLAHAFEGVQGPGRRSVMLMGMGMLGLWGVRLAQEREMDTILCLDVEPGRLSLARDAGATGTLDVSGMEAEEIAAFVKGHTAGRGADLCVDLTGDLKALGAGLASLRTGGILKLVGSVVPAEPLSLAPYEAVSRSLRIDGVHNYRPEHLAQALELLANPSHHEVIRAGVSKRFPLKEVDAAFQAAHERDALRVAVVCG